MGKKILATAVIVLVLLSGCDNGSTGGGSIFPSYRMVKVPGGTVPLGMAWGSSVNYELQQTISTFKIGETEVTYELWYAVYSWATANEYTFPVNTGREGRDGTDGAAPTDAKQEPVTTISWRDAVVWCNAYSEALGKTPVYYEDEGCTIILRESEDDGTADGDGKAERSYRKNSANGFRLPSEAQWEYAARGGVPSAGEPWTYTYAGSNTVGDVAVYLADKTAAVKSKAANTLGLYDMSGNVWEWCWDVFLGTRRVVRGGCWFVDAGGCAVSCRGNDYLGVRSDRMGFRVLCP